MSKVVTISSEAQLNQLISSHSVVVIDFFATWCGPCKAIAPMYERLATSLTEANKMVFTKVDVDQQRTIAQKHEITAMPTFVLYRNGAEADRVRGGEMQKLVGLVRNLLSESGGSAIASSSDSWTGGDIPKGYKNINSEVEVKGLDCMNWKSELGTIKSLFEATAPTSLEAGGSAKGKGKDSDTDWMESDTDEQLMLFIPFQSTVKVFQLQITSLPPDSDEDEAPKRPKTIKLFTNNAHILGFDEAEGREPIQTIELTEGDWKDGTAVINTRFVKFQAVGTLTIFVVDAEDEGECVRIDRIRIIGESGEKKDPGKLEKVGEDQ
ncbi:Thioredoxin [Dactylella cylindrospora]|nr:Thioredoxin [Dactylella cylindrospora]